MPAEYIRIKEKKSIEIIEKKSRFIATAGAVCNEEEARAFISDIKLLYRDASHHTYAYIIGINTPAARYSDDGEPHGTAGLPILNVMQGKEVTDSIIVVTRYFGGIKLGTGGLARAYSKSAADCMATAGLAGFIPGKILELKSDYHYLGKIKNYLEKAKYDILDEEYTGHVIIRTLIPAADSASFKIKIANMTNATVQIADAGEKYIEMEV